MLQSPPVSNLEFPPILEDVKCRRYKWLRSSTTQHNVPKGLNNESPHCRACNSGNTSAVCSWGNEQESPTMVQCVMAVSQDEFWRYQHIFGGEVWQSGEVFGQIQCNFNQICCFLGAEFIKFSISQKLEKYPWILFLPLQVRLLSSCILAQENIKLRLGNPDLVLRGGLE